jgi:large subunit ribosomal protein L18
VSAEILTERSPEGGPLIGGKGKMITQTQRNSIRQRIHARIRERLAGTTERPRLNVYRSLNHIYAQLIDDEKGQTLVSASSLALKLKTGGNVAAAKEIGKAVAERAVAKGIRRVVFDRGGYLYHGRIKALADAAREAGLEF